MGADHGDKDDFAAYVDARRVSLVQGVAALGTPPRHAAALTDWALALARRDWHDLRQSPDPGVEVWRLLLEVRADDTTPWWRAEPAVGSPRLDRLAPERRTSVVLSAVAGLDDADVSALCGEWPRPGDPDAVALETEARELAARVDVAPRAAAAAAGRPRSLRGPRARRGALGLVGLALVVGVGAWWQERASEAPDRGPSDVLGSAPVRTVDYGVPAPWWAAGELVLGDSAVQLRSVRRLARVDGSVVYSDAEGKVVFVDSTGFRLPLGRSEPGAALVSEQERGWVTWRDVASGELVVADAISGEELARRGLEPGVPSPDGPPVEPRPLAMEGPTVYYVDGAGSHSWEPLVEPTGGGSEEEQAEAGAGPAGLLDVDGLTTVVQVGRRTIWIDGPFGPPVERRGVGAQLSPGGGYVLTRAGAGRYSRLRVYDTVNGDRRPTGIAPHEIVVDAVFSTTGAITLVVGEASQVAGGDEFRRLSQARGWRLRTCFIGSGSCTDHVRVSSADGEPVLAP